MNADQSEEDPQYRISESELKYILSHDMEFDNTGIDVIIRSRTDSELKRFEQYVKGIETCACNCRMNIDNSCTAPCESRRKLNVQRSKVSSLCDDSCRRKHCGMKVPCCEEIP
jgi:hypothetical protein